MYKTLPKTISIGTDARLREGSADDVDNLLLECVPASGSADLVKLKVSSLFLEKRRAKWKPGTQTRRRNFLTCKEKRDLKIFDLKQGSHKFCDYVGLHQLWLDYMQDVIDISRLTLPEKTKCRMNYERLLKADYHGCMLVVKKATCPSLVGQSGIVLIETRNTFKIITKDDKIKCLPKHNTVFAFELHGHLISIFGNHFRVRTTERVRRKFKVKSTIDIG